jgi:hypothetical protein
MAARLYEPLAEWQMQRLPDRQEGYTLDLDSTVLERYGRQEGLLKGHNQRKHGRPSHHPLLAVLNEAHFLLHGWLRSGNCEPAGACSVSPTELLLQHNLNHHTFPAEFGNLGGFLMQWVYVELAQVVLERYRLEQGDRGLDCPYKEIRKYVTREASQSARLLRGVGKCRVVDRSRRRRTTTRSLRIFCRHSIRC